MITVRLESGKTEVRNVFCNLVKPQVYLKTRILIGSHGSNRRAPGTHPEVIHHD